LPSCAEEQLAELYRYIAAAASPDVAARYTEAIVTYCESLRTFPLRGTMRDDVRPGLRITNYRKRAVIAFDVAGTTEFPRFLTLEGRNHALGLAGRPLPWRSTLRPSSWSHLPTWRRRRSHRGLDSWGVQRGPWPPLEEHELLPGACAWLWSAVAP